MTGKPTGYTPKEHFELTDTDITDEQHDTLEEVDDTTAQHQVSAVNDDNALPDVALNADEKHLLYAQRILNEVRASLETFEPDDMSHYILGKYIRAFKVARDHLEECDAFSGDIGTLNDEIDCLFNAGAMLMRIADDEENQYGVADDMKTKWEAYNTVFWLLNNVEPAHDI